MTYPSVNQVLAGVVFGASNELTGTFVGPATADVKLGVAIGPSPSVGTLRVPLASQVKNGVAFGPADALTGIVTIPSANRVVAGWSYGAGGAEFVGTYDANLPTADQVLFGVSFGPGPSTGTVVLPGVASVEYGIHYGAQNASVGEFTGPGNSIPTTAQIVDAIVNKVLPQARMADGTIGEALQAGRAAVYGDRAMVGNQARYFGPDGTTLQKTMNVDDPTNPTTFTDGD